LGFFREMKDKSNKELKNLLGMIQNFGLLVLMLWFAFAFFLGIKMAPNDDMKPRISAGDILVYYRIDKDPSAQDVVVLKKNDTDYVGRVVAVEGDTVDITDESALIVNGNMVIEDMIYYTTPRYEGFVEYPVKLKQGECFVLADKREGGEDSRYYGPVNKKEIKGTVIGQFRRSNI